MNNRAKSAVTQVPCQADRRSALRALLGALTLPVAVPSWSQSGLTLGGLTAVDRRMPVFSQTALEGRQWTHADLLGAPAVVNFWATWCPPCRDEMPSLNRAWEQLQPLGVNMLAINAGEKAADIAAFVREVPIDFPVLLANDSGVMSSWSVRGLPTTLVIDQSGNVVYELVGPAEWDDEALLQPVRDLL